MEKLHFFVSNTFLRSRLD